MQVSSLCASGIDTRAEQNPGEYFKTTNGFDHRNAQRPYLPQLFSWHDTK